MAKSSIATPYPYEIQYKGKTIRCRSLDVMEQALDRLEGSKLAREVTPWGADEFQRFTGRIHIPQRRLLAKLLEYGTTAWLEDWKLRELLDIPDNQALAGVLSGISKVALIFGIEPRRVYAQDTFYKQGKPRHRYQITSAFLQAADKYKWPAKEDLRQES
jgi:hypothetical protein